MTKDQNTKHEISLEYDQILQSPNTASGPNPSAHLLPLLCHFHGFLFILLNIFGKKGINTVFQPSVNVQFSHIKYIHNVVCLSSLAVPKLHLPQQKLSTL